jgi:hypothetical protein
MAVTAQVIEMRRSERQQLPDVARSFAPASIIGGGGCPLLVQRGENVHLVNADRP